jgi:hypothetical protein
MGFGQRKNGRERLLEEGEGPEKEGEGDMVGGRGRAMSSYVSMTLFSIGTLKIYKT